MPHVIAREREQRLLTNLYQKESAELVSVTGRRRVGKTFLIEAVFADKIDFYLTGVQGSDKRGQLRNFGDQMARVTGKRRAEVTPDDWQSAFFQLTDYLEEIPLKKKAVVFFDELPWLATPRSGFLTAFSYFWNAWAAKRNIMVIICGSAASWMINKVVHHKGGLHNRITQRIQLEPFNLLETRRYLEQKQLPYPDYDIAELYMCFGGIPYYLNYLRSGRTVVQNVGDLLIDRFGALHDEFNRLYPALFDHAEKHIKVVRALAKHTYGLTRQELIKKTTLTDGGGISRVLEELEFSGFIKGFRAYGKKSRDRRYRLIDEYSNFYLRFIEQNAGENDWEFIRNQQTYKVWRGYAYENLGLRHLAQIKQALGIAGVATTTSTFTSKGTKDVKGLQIDLVIQRADRAVNLCEFKFYSQTITLRQADIITYQERRQRFRDLTRTNEMIFNTLVTPFGLQENSNQAGVINSVVTLQDFFTEE